MKEKIYIIGAGAIGKALAVSLKLNGKDVVILRGSVDGDSHHEEKIILLLSDGSEIEATIEFNTLSNFTELNGLIVLTNKSNGNATLAGKLKDKIKNSPLVILQNGLGVEQPFIDNGFSEIYRCVLFVTSQNIAENKIRYKPVAVSPIGIIKSKVTTLDSVVALIDSLNFKFKTETGIQKIIWEKAIANCVFNSICPLLETDNGIFHRKSEVFAIAQRVIKECVVVAKKNGMDITENEIEKLVLTISKLSDGQFISTLQDIRNKRKTEIDTLNFEIARIADGLHLGNLVQETKLLGELTKLKSELDQ